MPRDLKPEYPHNPPLTRRTSRLGPVSPVTFWNYCACEVAAAFPSLSSRHSLSACACPARCVPGRRDSGETMEGLWCMPEVDRVTLYGYSSCGPVLAFYDLTFTFERMQSPHQPREMTLRSASQPWPQPIAPLISFMKSEYASTALNCGNCFFTFSGARNRKPTCASFSIAVSLKESPPEIT